MKNLCYYHNDYLIKDVLLLIDVCHYFSSPGLSWGVMLKMTDIKLEKKSDIDKQLFIEKELRGGFLTLLKEMLKKIIDT